MARGAGGDASQHFGDGSDFFVPRAGPRTQSCLCQRLRALLNPAEVCPRAGVCSCALSGREALLGSFGLSAWSGFARGGVVGGGFVPYWERSEAGTSVSLVSHPPARGRAVLSLKTDPSSPQPSGAARLADPKPLRGRSQRSSPPRCTEEDFPRVASSWEPFPVQQPTSLCFAVNICILLNGD